MLCSCKEENVVIAAPPVMEEENVSNEVATETDNNIWKMLQEKGTEFSNRGMEYTQTAWTSLKSLYPPKETASDSGSVDENAEKSAYNFCGSVA